MSPSSRTTALGRIRPRAHLAAVALAVVAVLVLMLSSSASAQTDAADKVVIRAVTSATNGATTLDVMWGGAEGDLANAKLVENGQDVAISAPQKLKTDMGIVFVIDSGPNADQSGLLTDARVAISNAVAAHPGARYGIVQAGDKAEIKLDFTAEPARVKAVLDPSAKEGCVPTANDPCKPTSPIGPTKSAAIWDALALAGNMYEGRTLQPNVVLVAADNSSGIEQAEAIGKTAIRSHGVNFTSLNYVSGDFDPSSFQSLAEETGGGWVSAGDEATIEQAIPAAVNIYSNMQYQLTYNTAVPSGNPINLELTVNDHTATADAISGGGLVQGAALHPQLGSTARTLPFVDNQLALLVALGLAALAIAGIAYAFTLVFVKDDLTNVLSPYAEGYGLEAADEDESALGKSALIKRAVALTEQVAEQQGMLTRAEAALERANLPLRAGEALFIYVVIVIAAALIPLLLWRNLVPVLIFGVLGVLVPPAVVNFIAARRRKKFMSQLPDTLSLLSGTLRAGYSLMQGVEAVSQEVDEPMGLELRRVCTESRLGRPLEESLEASADRMDSPDFAWAVMAIRIQREVGGNLAELLMTVADTMIARERLRRDVAALTAEGRVSAVILGGLPPALGAIMYVLNPDYVSTLFKDGLGIAMVIMAVVSMLVGFLWMRKIINIEI